jgi:hypothetical protein
VVALQLVNSGDIPVTFTEITIHWPQPQMPPENQEFESLWRSVNLLWYEPTDKSPSTISDFMGEPALRVIQPGNQADLTFRFKRSVIGTSGYQITVEFDNGCSVTATR